MPRGSAYHGTVNGGRCPGVPPIMRLLVNGERCPGVPPIMGLLVNGERCPGVNGERCPGVPPIMGLLMVRDAQGFRLSWDC